MLTPTLLLVTAFAAQAGGFSETVALLKAGKEPVRIVCFGDSITGVYYHTGSRRAYTDMVGIALGRAYTEAKIEMINAGISGHTTRNALARIEADVLAKKPHLVVVMFGMNDVAGVPPDEFRRNLEQIILRCRGVGAEVLLCTQNSVYETTGRPMAKLALYTDFILSVGEQYRVPIADCFGAYEELREKDPQAWSLLMSDEIHPNMDGHKLFAEVIAKKISGKQISLTDVGPPEPALRQTRALVKAGKPLRVLAMPPYDKLVGPALTAVNPACTVDTESWAVDPTASVADLVARANAIREQKYDLVIVAPPVTVQAESDDTYFRGMSAVFNRSLSFGQAEWDCIGIAPSVAQRELNEADQARDALFSRIVRAQDLDLISRPKGNTESAEESFGRWMREKLTESQSAQ